MCGVLISICVLFTLSEGASNKRLEDQLNSARKDISYLYEDISKLSKDVENINKTIWSKDLGGTTARNKKIADETRGKTKDLDNNLVSSREIVQLLEAFESEKILNRKLQNQIQQIQDRLEATENKNVRFEMDLELEKIQNQQCQERLTALEENSKIENSNRILSQQSLARLKTLEEKNSDINVLNLKFQARLEVFEDKNVDIIKSIESVDQFKIQVLDRLKELENSDSDFKTELEAEKQLRTRLQYKFVELEDNTVKTYKEMAENITSLAELFHCNPGDNTSSTLKGSNFIPSPVTETTTMVSGLKSCKNAPSTGQHDLFFSSIGTTKSVYCDTVTDGGGWIVIMRRQDGSVNFTRSWNDYKHGFGNVGSEFWIGNDALHDLTNPKALQLRLDFEDFDGNKAFATYDRFQIGSEVDKYILSVSDYSGTAGDSFGNADAGGGIHNGMKFSTFDSINDKSSTSHGWCIKTYPGGWWLNNCFNSHLTAEYRHGSDIACWHGVLWYSWLGPCKSLKFVEMKLR